MAGAGYKLFNTGDVLTAAQVNTYLQEQVVMVFANATARTTALSGVLAEGMVSFLKDTDSLEIYSGSAWVAYGSGDITGITTGATSGLTGGVTSGTADLKFNTTAKGGLLVGTGSGTVSELTVGSNNTVLTADSSTATGLKWASASATGANWSLLNAGGTALTGAATITVSGISSKEKIMVLVNGGSPNNANGGEIWLRLNGDTNSNYNYYGGTVINRNTFGTNVVTNTGANNTYFRGCGASLNADTAFQGGFIIEGCNSSGVKPIWGFGAWDAAGSYDHGLFNRMGYYSGSSTISSISVVLSNGNWDAGTVFVYTTA